MASRKVRELGAYVFVFQLGKGAKVGKKRVPTAYTTAPCYYYRSDRRALAKQLEAIPEPDVAEADVDVTFAAIDAFVEQHALRHQLYSDAEIQADRAHAEVRGFHAGATFDEAKAALARGGFRVVDLGRPAGVARDLDELARHLDLTSLDVVLDSVQRFVSGLGLHADAAAALVIEAIAKDGAAALADAVRAAAPGWSVEMRDTLLVAAAYAGLRHARYRIGLHTKEGQAMLGALRSFLDALPPAKDATVRRRLGAWGLRNGAEGKALPRELPRSLDEALALVDALGFAADRGKPAKGAGVPKLPEVLRDFYARHDRLGERTIVAPGKLAALRAALAGWIEEAEDGEVEADEIDVRTLSKPKDLVPFGKDSGGDFFFLDPAFAAGGALPVLRFVHDEGPTCRLEASSLPSFIAAYGLRDAFGLGLRGDEIDALVARDRARVRR